MLRRAILLHFYVLSLFALISCQDDTPLKDEGSGKMQLSFSQDAVDGGRLQQESLSILLSIKNAAGELVHEKKKLMLFKFGEEYLSEPIALSTGDFQITEFIILNENNEAVYATPLTGSKLAYLVKTALPMNFTISKDVTIKVVPQVLECASHSPADFGYNTFSFDVVKTFPFLIGVLTYDDNTKNFELTTSHLLIKMGNVTLFDDDLKAETNTVVVKNLEGSYQLTVTKDGYAPFQKSFTTAELKQYFETPLVVTLMNNSILEGLIAYYPFNGNALDSTANNHDGIVHEATLTTDRHGNSNASYSFDGENDYITVAHASALNLTGDFTISLWTQVAGTQVPHEGINDILRKWNGDAEGYPFAIAYLNPLANDLHEDKFIYVRYDGQGCDNAPTSYSPTIQNDVFQHIVLVKQGNALKQYLNNVLIQEFVDETVCNTGNTADMTIGCRGNLVRFFKGKIDDIRIYGRAVSPAEVANLFAE